MMPMRIHKTVYIIFFICCNPMFSPARAFCQQTQSVQSTDPFDGYFNGLAISQDIGSHTREDAYEKLVESIGAMTPTEIAAGITVIDRQIDNTDISQNPWAKRQAVYLLRFISGRPDGPELLASQMDRLSSMLNDPSHSLGVPALMVLQMISYKRPNVAFPILEAALKGPEVNNKTGIGPSIATSLLFMGPYGDDMTRHTEQYMRAMEDIVQYMRRPDITQQQLLNTIVIDGFIPDILAAELVRCLDISNDHIKSRALVGISRSSAAAKDASRMRLQQMANDPRETAHVRRLAGEALAGQITEDPNPESDK